MGKLIVNQDIVTKMITMLDNTNLKLTDCQKEVLKKFIDVPESILLETEYPIVCNILHQLKADDDGREKGIKMVSIIDGPGKVEEWFPEKEDK